MLPTRRSGRVRDHSALSDGYRTIPSADDGGAAPAGAIAAETAGGQAAHGWSGEMADFAGRTILVTGASGGIGGATVRRLVDADADVIAGGRSVEALDKLAAGTGARVL